MTNNLLTDLRVTGLHFGRGPDKTHAIEVTFGGRIFKRTGFHSKNSEFRQQYALAREVQAEHHIDEIVEIADDGTNDYMEKRNADGALVGWTENGENVQRSRLRVDTRKWAASKLAPKKYGDKQVDEHSGPDGGPITLEALITASLKKE